MKLKASDYNDLSVAVTKSQLNTMVNSVLKRHYKIFWGFNKGKMILNIYDTNVINKLTFIRRKGFLELINAQLTSQFVIHTLDSCIDFTSKMNSNDDMTIERSKNTIYQEIDYYLLKLHEQKKMNHRDNVEKIKLKLGELYTEWTLCK